MPDRLTLVYVADPLCSWCWGFAPVVRALARETGDRVGWRLVMGGLRPGPHAERVDEKMKATLRHHWHAVRERSGQPFDMAFFERENFLYDSDPPARAVVAVRRLAPERELTFLHALQEAFYAGNVDVTDGGEAAVVAERVGLDPALFHALHDDPETFDLTQRDYESARRMGITGFPALLLQKGGLALRLAHGWAPLAQVRAALDEGRRQLGIPG